MKNIEIVSKVVSREGEAKHSPSKDISSANLSDYLLKSIWDKVWEIRTDSQGIEYIFGKIPVVTQYGVTMYSGDGVDVPSLASGLPFDGRTIWYNPDTQQIEVIGGTGEGSGGGVSNFWDLSGIPSWITTSKPKYTYSEIEGTPDLTKYALVSQIPSLSGYATESWVLQKDYATKATTLSGYGITDAYTKANVDDLLKSYVTLGGTQTITGEKNFTGGLKVNGSPIYYDTDKKYWKLEGDLLVTGGITMYGNEGSYTPSTIMDAIAVDGTTISKSGGVLKVIGGTGGGVADSVAWANITGKPNFASVATSGKYDDLIGKPKLLSSFTDDIVSGKYLLLSGGRLSSNDANILELYRTNGQGGAWVDYYAANQSSVYWRVGSSVDHTFRWEYTSGNILMSLNSLGILAAKGIELDYANIGYKSGHQTINRAQVSIISTENEASEIILGANSTNYWSISSRGNTQGSSYWLYNYNKKGTNLEADYNSFSVRIGKGSQSPYEKIDSSYALDVCGKTRTTSLYGASEQLNIIAASGYNATLRSNGGASGYNVTLDTTSNSLRPFADSHLLLDLGSSNIYWRNIYSQKLILKSPSADALSIYRTVSGGGAFADFYPTDQTENYWRIGALNDYNCVFLYNGDANTNHVSIAPQGHLSVGHTLTHTSNVRAELSVVSINDAPCDIMLGSNKSAHWSISSRDSSMNNNLIIHSYQGTKMVFEINKDGCCRIGKNSSWTAPTSTITLDVLGSTRTNNIYGTNVNLALISSAGANVELQANGQLAGYKVCLDVVTQSFRPFTDSHALIDLGSANVYWKNIYAQKSILTSNDAGALSLYRTNEYGVYIDYYPSNQKVNKWRVGASSGGVFQWENYNGQIVGRFASSSTTGTRFEVGKPFLNIQNYGTDVDRAVITLISESDYPTDLIMGANKYAWSITTRSSTEDYLLGFYSALTSQYAMKIYKEGNVLVAGGITMYSDQRKKTILNHVELSLKDIANAPLIEHYYNGDDKKTTHVGSIAQYWANMNDWFCKLDSEGYYTMEIQNCALASAISIARELDRYETKTDKAIKKLKKRICELEEEVERLKSA